MNADGEDVSKLQDPCLNPTATMLVVATVVGVFTAQPGTPNISAFDFILLERLTLKLLAASLAFLAIFPKLGNASQSDDSKSPAIQAAELAAETGDYRLMSAPTCFDGLPGYHRAETPKPWPPKKAGLNCKELISEAVLKEMEELNAYAEAYNRRLLALQAGDGTGE